VAQTLPRVFLHAFCSDGRVSSICRRCQITIATKSNEIDLRKPEEWHICSNLDLAQGLHSKRVAGGEN
jgi:hypothetical protein